MKTVSFTHWAAISLAVFAITLTILAGIALRLDDPLSSPVVAAEDPYTHMALVREHVRDGSLAPLNEGGALYPPGMHSFIAAAWVYTGAELYELIRLGPALLGGIGILGMALLLWRIGGPVAAFVGALAFAVAPEMIFRSTMMAPTALDLAVLPFLLYAVLEILRGRLGWIGVAAPVSLFLVFAHPWLLLVLGAAGFMFLLLSYVLPWAVETAPPVSGRGVGAIIAILGVSIAFADFTAKSFRGTLNAPESLPFGLLITLVGVAGLIPALLLIFAPKTLDVLSTTPRNRRRWQLWISLAASAAIAVTLLLVTQRAFERGMPEYVDLAGMFGMPILVLAAAGLIALPFIRSPVAHLGAALVIVTYPFVMFNPLQSDFWPHRTAAFLGFGLVILVGTAAGALFRLTATATRRWMERSAASPRRRHVSPAFAVGIPAILVAVSLGGGVFAGTPEGWGGWYRLYEPCEMDAFQEVADIAEEDPEATFITGSWQSKLVLAALGKDASRMWFDQSFFYSDDRREDVLWNAQYEGRAVYVVIDRHFQQETPDADRGFLEQDPWREAGRWCEGLGGFERASVVLHVADDEVSG